jgi:hypothetical protein
MQTVPDGSIRVDSVLDEPWWSLDCPEFWLDPKTTTGDAPCFAFLKDKSNLYVGARYALGEQSPSSLEADVLSFRINLVSLLGDYSREARIRFLPCDELGAPRGRAFVDCPHYNQDIMYDFASRVDSSGWTLEFSIPLREVMAQADRCLFYQMSFRNRLRTDGQICFYPTAEVGRTPDGREIVLAGYRNYFEFT